MNKRLSITAIVFLSHIIQRVQAETPKLIGQIKSDTTRTLFGYRIVPLGDQNGDGYGDILVWDYRCSAYIYCGGNPFNSEPVLRIDSVGARICQVGDINGDSIDDIAMNGRSPVGWKLNAYLGGSNMDTIRDLWFGLDNLFGIGFTANGHDINSNGSSELISWSNLQNSVLFFELQPNYDSIPDLVLTPANIPYLTNGYSFGEGLITGYFNGDNYPDLAVNLRYPSQKLKNGSVFLYWGGPAFDTLPDLIVRRPGPFQETYDLFGMVLENLGDVNGDGYDDFFAGRQASPDTVSFVYFGGSALDTIPDLTISETCGKARWAGDLNGDGNNDLITSNPVSLSGYGDVYVYLGGPHMDSIPDFALHNWQLPGYRSYFGLDCSGIGDFNGDGVNDFAFSAINGDGFGVVYIYSGWTESTDVKYEYSPNLPESFSLFQNYPNPFNSETKIKFDVPTRCHVRLGVRDITGREVVKLIDKQVPAGEYSVLWDGRNRAGHELASGVYIIKLTSGSVRMSVKAILMR